MVTEEKFQVKADRSLDPELLAAMQNVVVDKPVIPSYAQFKAVRQAGGKMNRFNILMHLTLRDKEGNMTGCQETTLPAEKTLKYLSQDMHFVDGPPHVKLQPGPEAVTPEQLMGTAVGKAVAETMADRGRGATTPQTYPCEVEGCSRFFDSVAGKRMHEKTHKTRRA